MFIIQSEAGISKQKVFFKITAKYGGLPYLINLPLKEETANEYLKSVYNTIVFRDVVDR